MSRGGELQEYAEAAYQLLRDVAAAAGDFTPADEQLLADSCDWYTDNITAPNPGGIGNP